MSSVKDQAINEGHNGYPCNHSPPAVEEIPHSPSPDEGRDNHDNPYPKASADVHQFSPLKPALFNTPYKRYNPAMQLS
jgi:hypothetical protein